MNKQDRIIMDKLQNKVDKNHDTLLKLEPTINRLSEYFKPKGKFEEVVETVNNNKITTRQNSGQLKFIWVLITGTILSMLFLMYQVFTNLNGGG